ncbi:class I adenylate-forming enzyme family protein [Gordonia sp. KTR9]|uniref:class I adenylate-forming enzyme family protein n=1 Tax=Gordonia sp. KTR9 TaxID=337191 RepID=UPI0002F6FABA|nr:class I adenylate-forming enzyme family protein [Gordonia sp. KTR9]
MSSVAINRPEAATLGALVTEIAQRQPAADAVVCGQTRLSWEELDEQVRNMAAGLLRLGVRAGDRVALLAPNSAEWIVTELAVASTGAIFMGLNTWYKASDLEFVLAHSGARVVITVDQLFGAPVLEMVQDVASRCTEVEQIIVIGDAPAGTIGWHTLVATPSGQCPAEPHSDDPAVVLYTSGTTADPKGVVLHHRGLIDNGWEIGERQHLTSDDRLWLGIPLFFSFGSANAIMAALTHGVAMIVQEKFDAGTAVELIQRENCSVYYGMGHMTAALLEETRRRGIVLDSMRTGLTIGPEQTIRMTAELVPQICNVYGLTETYGNCAVTDCAEPLDVRATSQGLPLPGMRIRVIDPETGLDCETGQVGLILVGGRVTSGYYRDPIRTAEALDEAGWFDTGDHGHLDEQGRVHYTGRSKEMLKVGGINVSPIGVENVLLDHPAVRQAFVIGRPHTERGELPVGILEWSGPGPVDEADLAAHCRSRLPSYAVPVEFIAVSDDQLPRTDTGKVRRGELASLVAKE